MQDISSQHPSTQPRSGYEPSLTNKLREGVEAFQKALLEIIVFVKFLDELCDVHVRDRVRLELYAGCGAQKDLQVMLFAFYGESAVSFESSRACAGRFTPRWQAQHIAHFPQGNEHAWCIFTGGSSSAPASAVSAKLNCASTPH